MFILHNELHSTQRNTHAKYKKKSLLEMHFQLIYAWCSQMDTNSADREKSMLAVH